MLGKLIVVGAAVLNLGTIRETDGVVSRNFWLRNDGSQKVTIVQGYGSCGCTTVSFPKDSLISPGDSVLVTMHFDPRGKGGDFYETGTLRYRSVGTEQLTADSDNADSGRADERRDAVSMSFEGTCVTSEETLLLQHPIVVNETLRVSRNRFDLGYVSVGQEYSRTVSVWHRDTDFTEPFTVRFTPMAKTPKGLNHVPCSIVVPTAEGDVVIIITLDAIVR